MHRLPAYGKCPTNGGKRIVSIRISQPQSNDGENFVRSEAYIPKHRRLGDELSLRRPGQIRHKTEGEDQSSDAKNREQNGREDHQEGMVAHERSHQGAPADLDRRWTVLLSPAGSLFGP